MAKNDSKVTDNPKLKQKKLSDGQLSLYLEYYLGYSKVEDKVKIDRRKESLNLYIWATPRTTEERLTNKETLELAKKIRNEREQELREGKLGYRLSKAKNVNFLDYFQTYIDNYTKKDVRMLIIALNRFKDFLSIEYPVFRTSIKPEQLSKDMMLSFVEYLQSRSKGEGAKSIFQRFKKAVSYAVEHDVIMKNPCKGVQCKVDEQILRKDVLSVEEMQQLISTTYTEQNQDVRRAFILCLYAGIRFCDVVELRYGNVDYSNRLLKFEQSKTKGGSSSSGVVVPLNDSLISLIGKPSTEGAKNEKIFNLPSHTMCLKALRRWTARAGIDKHITWHSARHSFAVNILNNGANMKTVASLLGHSGLKHTEKYTRAVDSLKEAAINSLPTLEL
ncbi:site-specific integrase [Dysgonomonas sp. BGC7]|uniref:site-specific integrase n=1 Tax=Dysgonomonas sp. BGC7 TaxID=1658008 RepID=UPI00068308E6|nr:site-specific integrase [Dysgonomonas sp. BGC7]MBD8387920.1 site-specific integrase [Dysgonomonas sp. BGC7]